MNFRVYIFLFFIQFLIVFQIYAQKQINKYVGIDYGVWWTGFHDVIANNPNYSSIPYHNIDLNANNQFGGPTIPHIWSEPCVTNGDFNDYRLMLNGDEAQPNSDLIHEHADLLYHAGVDFITPNLTNGFINTVQLQKSLKETKALCSVFENRNPENTPKVVPLVRACEVGEIISEVFEKYNSDIFFIYNGKPLILVWDYLDFDTSNAECDFLARRISCMCCDSTSRWMQ